MVLFLKNQIKYASLKSYVQMFFEKLFDQKGQNKIPVQDFVNLLADDVKLWPRLLQVLHRAVEGEVPPRMFHVSELSLENHLPVSILASGKPD
jgi:hypothetical protein